LTSGVYWLNSPDRHGKVYCDMQTDQGGWTLISRYTIENGIIPNPVTQPLGEVFDIVASNFTMSIRREEYANLYSLLRYSQIKFYCYSDISGKTFHIKTMPNKFFHRLNQLLVNNNDLGESSCGSFAVLPDDNSYMSQHCGEWGNTGNTNFVGKWSNSYVQSDKVLYHSLIYIYKKAT